MAGEMVEKVEEVKADTMISEDDIDVKTRDKEIHIRKWWMIPLVVASFVFGIMAIVVTMAVTGAIAALVEIFK